MIGYRFCVAQMRQCWARNNRLTLLKSRVIIQVTRRGSGLFYDASPRADFRFPIAAIAVDPAAPLDATQIGFVDSVSGGRFDDGMCVMA